MVPICRHILPAGHRCTQPAVNKTLYCRHHQTVKLTLSKVKPESTPYGLQPLPFVFPEDRAALQINYMIVLSALNDKKITLQNANAFNRILRSCASNLKQGALTQPNIETQTRRDPDDDPYSYDSTDDSQNDASAMVRSVILTPEGEEIAEHHEVSEEEEEAEHGATCPCRRCAEEFRAAPPEQHHPRCACGLCPKPTEKQAEPNAPVNQAAKQEAPTQTTDQIPQETENQKAILDCEAPITLEMVERAEQWVRERSEAANESISPPKPVSDTQASLSDRFHKAQYAATAIAAGLGPEIYKPWT